MFNMCVFYDWYLAFSAFVGSKSDCLGEGRFGNPARNVLVCESISEAYVTYVQVRHTLIFNTISCGLQSRVVNWINTVCVTNFCHTKFHWAYHVVHYMQLRKAYWGRQTAFVAMKTKSISWLDVEDDLICALSWIESGISILSNNKQDQPWH